MAFDRIVVPLLQAYRPDVLVLELGMDTLAGDPLTHLRLTNNAHVEVIQRLQRCACPVLVAGGGVTTSRTPCVAGRWLGARFAGEGEEDDFSLGLGGVMLASTEWAGGLRDACWRSRRSNVRPSNQSCAPRLKPLSTLCSGLRVLDELHRGLRFSHGRLTGPAGSADMHN